MRILSVSLVVGLLGASVIVAAQPAGTPMRIRGTVRSLDGSTLLVETASDGAAEIRLPAEIGVTGVARKSATDITDGVFIGTTAALGADGRWHASEVHIFPETMRGAGEGHYPWDFPDTTMTNGTVSGAVSASHGRELRVGYTGGRADVTVGPETAIVALVPGDRSLLVPGAAVFVLGMLRDDGTFDAVAITAEKDGVKPPM